MSHVRRIGGIPLPAGRLCPVYDESSLRVMLDVEREQARASGRAIVLVLITARPGEDHNEIVPTLRGALDCVAGVFRETDFAGWLRQDRVVTAVLLQDAASTERALRLAITQRILDDLARTLTTREIARLRVRCWSLNPVLSEVRNGW